MQVSVDFYADGALVGAGVPSGGATYSAVWLGASAGTHALTAVATDDAALGASAAPVTIVVGAPVTPTLQCTTQAEGSATKTSLKNILSCNQLKLLNGPGYSCTIAAAPACAGSIAADAAALASGANNPPLAAIDNTAFPLSRPSTTRHSRRRSSSTARSRSTRPSRPTSVTSSSPSHRASRRRRPTRPSPPRSAASRRSAAPPS